MNREDLSALVGAGENRQGWPQVVVQHPWDPMVGIPTRPERACVRLRCVEICCSYDEHKEYSHAMCMGSWNCTCAGYALSSD
jgi:hypothetical protein